MNCSKLLGLAATGLCAASLGACSTMGAGGMAYSPRMETKASDEKAFATTFASCRDQVRAGRTDKFDIAAAGPAARNLTPGDTGLMLKVPYDKAKGGSKASRMAQDDAHKAAMSQCLAQNGYQVKGWDSASR